MKKKIAKKTESELLENFSIKSKINGWRFRYTEISNNCWKVGGQNQWGKKVSNSGGDPELLQEELEVLTLKINQD